MNGEGFRGGQGRTAGEVEASVLCGCVAFIALGAILLILWLAGV